MANAIAYRLVTMYYLQYKTATVSTPVGKGCSLVDVSLLFNEKQQK